VAGDGNGPGEVTGVLAGLGRMIGIPLSRCIEGPACGEADSPVPP